MKYTIEIELPDNDTVRESIKTDEVEWFWHGCHGRAKAKENRWISVSERLPKDTGDYLVWALFVCEEYPTYSIVHYDADCEAFGEWNDIYDPHTLGFLDSVFEEIEGVIAWMPLPRPYDPQYEATDD